MKRILPIVLLFGGLIIFSGVLDKAFTTSSAVADSKPNLAIIIKIKPVDPSLSNHSANVVQVGTTSFQGKGSLSDRNGSICLSEDEYRI